MKSIAIRYAGLVVAMVFIFGNFVACGAQMYKVSMEDDVVYVTEPVGMRDPTSNNFGLSQPKGWVQLPVRFQVDRQLSQDQLTGLMRAMRTWELAVGKKLFSFDSTMAANIGDDFRDIHASLDDYVNGNYLNIDWDRHINASDPQKRKTKFVLASTVWSSSTANPQAIHTADVHFNSQYYLIGDAFQLEYEQGREVVDMETLALHELGHLLGLAHVGRQHDPHSIMVPEVYIGEGLTNRLLSADDVRRVQRIYGCSGTACDVDKTMALIQQQLTIDEDKQYAIYQESVEDGELTGH